MIDITASLDVVRGSKGQPVPISRGTFVPRGTKELREIWLAPHPNGVKGDWYARETGKVTPLLP